MAATEEHTCVAEHCVACCPTARAYSDGVQLGKDLYAVPEDKDMSLVTLGLLGVAGALVSAVFRDLVRQQNAKAGS